MTGHQMKLTRIRLNLTQTEFAQICNFDTRSRISTLESKEELHGAIVVLIGLFDFMLDNGYGWILHNFIEEENAKHDHNPIE